MVRAGDETDRRNGDRIPTVIKAASRLVLSKQRLHRRCVPTWCPSVMRWTETSTGNAWHCHLADGFQISTRVVAATSLGIHSSFENIDAKTAEIISSMIEKAKSESDMFRDICVTAAKKPKLPLLVPSVRPDFYRGYV